MFIDLNFFLRWAMWPRRLLFFIRLKIFSLIWSRHYYQWTFVNFDLYSTLMVIEQWRFFSAPHLLSHGPPRRFFLCVGVQLLPLVYFRIYYDKVLTIKFVSILHFECGGTFYLDAKFVDPYKKSIQLALKEGQFYTMTCV